MLAYNFTGEAKDVYKLRIDNPKEFAQERLERSSSSHDILSYGYYRYMGWQYDFRPYLKRYVYKSYGQWHEAFATNQKTLRKAVGVRIEEIVEIKK